MNKKIVLPYVFLVFFCIQATGQNGQKNQLNDQDEKIGLWIENDGNIEAYYKNGVKDGLFKSYNRKNGKLSAIGEFREGTKSGTWYYFDEAGILILKECEIQKNTQYTRIRDDGKEITPRFTSYAEFYYANGYLKEEGRVLYSEDIEIDFFRTGKWKYYNEKGIPEDTQVY